MLTDVYNIICYKNHYFIYSNKVYSLLHMQISGGFHTGHVDWGPNPTQLVWF